MSVLTLARHTKKKFLINSGGYVKRTRHVLRLNYALNQALKPSLVIIANCAPQKLYFHSINNYVHVTL